MGRAAGKSSTKDSKGSAAVLARRSVEASEPLPAIDAEGRFTGAGARGLTFERRWTTPGVHPYDEVSWEQRTASISSESGKSVFEQTDVEVPASWSQLATNVVVSKYFRGHIGTAGRERSVRQLIDRVVNTICAWAATQRYFATDADLATFKAELTHLLLHQKMAFNSPVWFNVGVEPKSQTSACFINSVDDNMGSIMDLAKTEAMLFKYGSGAGVNLSTIRGSKERMSGGGIASGPVSFMKGFDAFAGVVKSGGKTRRAAKMVILNADHPDIVDFVDSKANEEKKAWALIEQGYDGSFTGEAYGSIFYQNANHSVRVTDEFMRAVERDGDWTTYEVTTGEPVETFKARDLFRKMAEAAHLCGDPGIQYDTIINDWHTSSNTDRIHASNPCCFVGETLVDTTAGFITFTELERMDRKGQSLPATYSHDRSTGNTVVQPINRAWVAGYTNHLVEVRTELGRVLRCTPEHRWLTFEGEYVEAQDLRPGTRLRKIYREEAAGRTTGSWSATAAATSASTAATQAVVITNDRVLSVEHIELGDAVPVFDMEVEGTHNFGVSDSANPSVRSVVVSNSEYMFLNDTACFAPETRISTPQGLRTVVDLFEAQRRGEPVMVTTDIRGERDHRRLTAHRPAHVTEVGERPVFRMRLSDGRQIRTTADHRFLTSRGTWKEVQELEPGVDRIAIRESGNPIAFESSEAETRRWRMLGWMTGDGVFSKGNAALVFGPSERGTAEWMAHEFNLLLEEARVRAETVDGVERSFWRGALLTDEGVSMPIGSRGMVRVGTQASGVLQMTSKAPSLVRLLEDQYGFQQGTAIHKDVPTEVQRVADDLKVAYLQGLFSADGCIRQPAAGTEPEVMLASSSQALLRSVQLLLADLGINGRITWMHPTGRKNPQGQLHISNEQARTFLALIGFPDSESKSQRAARVLGTAFAGAHKNPRPAKVLSIEPDGIETVYDITEPATHSVIAEGLIAHNCNLASLNLMKFANADGEFDPEAYRYAAKLTITAQEILIDNASYPTPQIERNSHLFRPLGLGYANLGALLMSRGLAYDSDEGRAYAATLTAIMTGEAYAQSARVARDHGGPFAEYGINEKPFLRVIRKHRDAAYQIPESGAPQGLIEAARSTWDEALELGTQHGYRNAQVTVLAPTGTIAFMMDCDTTGIEPDIALIKYKKLVGEGFLKIVNQTVPGALKKLGYSPEEVESIVAYVNERETIEGAPGLKAEHLSVFDCAFKPVNGERSIHYMGHVRMMGATQPFLSGAISKTVNMPEAASAEEIEDVYLQGWKLGLKAIAIYRDGSKRSQPLSTGKKLPKLDELDSAGAAALVAQLTGEPKPYRRRLPDERRAITHKFQVAGHEGYITVGLYPDGQPGEIFLKMAKEGSTVSGLMDSLATMTSIALQYGVPLRDLVNKFAHSRFEPAGFTGNQEIPIAKSVVDYVFRWMGSRFLSRDERDALGIISRAEVVEEVPAGSAAESSDASGGAPLRGTAGDTTTGSEAAASPNPPPAPDAPTTSGSTTPDDARAIAITADSPSAGPLPMVGSGYSNGNGNGHAAGTAVAAIKASLGASTKVAFSVSADSPSCAECGSIMVRNGSCYKCLNCGSTSGCS